MAQCTPVHWHQFSNTDDEEDFDHTLKRKQNIQTTEEKMKFIEIHEPRLFTKPCKNLWKYGYCKFGEKCIFRHSHNHDEQINYHYDIIKQDVSEDYDTEPDEDHLDDFEEQERISLGRKSILDIFDKLSEKSNSGKEEVDEEVVDGVVEDVAGEIVEDIAGGVVEDSQEEQSVPKLDDELDSDKYNPIIDEHLIMSFEEDEEAIEMFDSYLSNEQIEIEDEFEEFYLENKMVSEYYEMVNEYISNILPFTIETFGIYPISIDFGVNMIII